MGYAAVITIIDPPVPPSKPLAEAGPTTPRLQKEKEVGSSFNDSPHEDYVKGDAGTQHQRAARGGFSPIWVDSLWLSRGVERTEYTCTIQQTRASNLKGIRRRI